MGRHSAGHAIAEHPASSENELDTLADFGRYLAAPLAIALVTLVAYVAFLGWDTQKDIGPDGSQTGPYEPWQVLALTGVLVALAAVATWKGHAIAAALMPTIVLTTAWSVQASADPTEPNLWPVGAFMLFFGALCGLSCVAAITGGVRSSLRTSTERQAYAAPQQPHS